jgi:hypothetical protein
VESLKTILYFSIFKYPLKLEEICKFTPANDRAQVEAELEYLMHRGIVNKIGEFFLPDCDSSCIEKRLKGNEMAIPALQKAAKMASFIAKFPFVEAVAVSGSLSKGYFDRQSDIDYFVITNPGKLWVARTLLMLFKKIFLFNSRKYFCINYFLASPNLEVEEKNRFTATEIKTLIPFQGKTALESFYAQNKWVNQFFGTGMPELSHVPEITKPLMVRGLEVMLDSRPGQLLDVALRTFTVRFWKLKFRKMASQDFRVALKSTEAVSKHHPSHFQKRVITALNEKYDELLRLHDINLPKEYA